MNRYFLNLGKQPLANKYSNYHNKNQIRYNLKLYFNTKTKLVSISKRISSKKMFNKNYPYRSSMSKTMTYSFVKLSKLIKKKFNPDTILEIGSNDGALLKNFNKKNSIGIEPCSNLAAITKKMGYKTYNNYWNLELAKKIKRNFNKIDLIYSANTITHISNLDNVFKSISNVLSKKGVLIIEDPSLLECLKKVSYDQFYNEHIYVFSLIALNNIVNKYQFEIFDVQKLKTHGGSLRYFIKRKENKNYKIKSSVKKQIILEEKFGLDKMKTYVNFSKLVLKSKLRLVKLLKDIKKKKKKIIGYGATAKATTVLNYCNIDNNLIDFFVDTTPEKKNKFMPGKNIKIFKYKKKIIDDCEFIFLGAWNFKFEIFKKEKKFIKRGGKFISHIPYPHLI